MKPISAMKFLQMTTLSKPVADRLIYKLIRKRQVKSIVEIGLEDGSRCSKIISVASKFNPDAKIKYTGVDLFDAREDGAEPLKLIEMHRKLNAIDAKTQLVPGDLASALPVIANAHVRTDMVIISAGFEDEDFDSTVSYLPRMLHASSIVLVQDYKGEEFFPYSRLEIEKMVAKAQTEKKQQRKAA